MTRLARRTISAIAMLALLTLAACGDGSNETLASGSNTGDARPDTLTIGGADQASAAQRYAEAYAEIIGTELPDVTVEVVAGDGSVENVQLVAAGEFDLGISQADVAYHAYHGTGEFADDAGVRVLAAVYPNYLQLATLADAGIRRFSHLEGAYVSVGKAGGGQDAILREVAHALGYSFDMFGGVRNFSYAEQETAFRMRQIDVGAYVAELGEEQLLGLASSRNITFVEFSDDELQAITEAAPYFSRGTILGSIYDSLDNNIPAPTLWNYVVVSQDMDDDLAYELTRMLYDNARSIEASAPQAFETNVRNLEHIVVPLHPGSARYFREQGADVPEEAQPDG